MVLRDNAGRESSKLVNEKVGVGMLTNSFKPIKEEKIVSVSYTQQINIGETYGTVAKVIEFMTVKEFFRDHDSIDEGQMMIMDYCSDKEDPCLEGDQRFGDDCIIVKYSESGNPNNIDYMPILDFYETYIVGKND